MFILVTGGLGYIGSHTVVELLQEGYNVVIADNLSNSSIDILDKIKQVTNKNPEFFEIDVNNEILVNKLFEKYSFEAIIHFAGFKAVGESVEKPLMYYSNNLGTTITLTKACLKYNVNKFIFSSSATVYGDNIIPFKEDMQLLPTTSPYGETKAMCERILKDIVHVNKNFSVSLLRYFNPIGSHESGMLCEQPKGKPNNLIPFITAVAKGEQDKLLVFGNDYDTIDGTGVRDYIHVVDLAKGHVLALKHIKSGTNIYNLGTGNGKSVLQVINAFEKAHNIKIPYEVVDRRAGDLGEFYADTEKAKKELGFVSKYSLLDMCKHSYSIQHL